MADTDKAQTDCIMHYRNEQDRSGKKPNTGALVFRVLLPMADDTPTDLRSQECMININ